MPGVTVASSKLLPDQKANALNSVSFGRLPLFAPINRAQEPFWPSVPYGYERSANWAAAKGIDRIWDFCTKSCLSANDPKADIRGLSPNRMIRAQKA